MKVSTKAAPAETPYKPAFLVLEHIVTSKNLPMRSIDSEHVEELFQSLKRTGLDNPLDVWAGESEGSKMKIKDETLPMSFIIAGGHRREALKRLKAEEPNTFSKFFPAGIPVRLRTCPLTEALLLQLRENVQRKEMSAEQILPVLKHLTELGMKQNQIAARVGKSTGWVSQLSEISAELGEEGAEEVAKGGLTVRHARSAAKAVKAAKAKGEPVDAKAELKKAKEAHEAAKQGNAKRAKKRVGLRSLFERYNALPGSKLTIGKKLQILEGIIAYALKDTNSLPAEVKNEPVSE